MFRAIALLLALLAALAAACADDSPPRGTPTAVPPTGTPAPARTPAPLPTAPPQSTAAPGEDGVLVIGGVSYVAVDRPASPAGALEPVQAQTAPDVPVYREAAGAAPWLRYTRAAGGYQAWIPKPVRLAQEEVAAELRVRPDAVTVTAVEAVEWPNSCLGMEEIATFCAQVITPGFRITLAAGGTTYVYHSDRDERVVRAQPRS